MEKKDLIIVSAISLVDRDGRILISKRSENKFVPGYWEFPGGKLEEGETSWTVLNKRDKRRN